MRGMATPLQYKHTHPRHARSESLDLLECSVFVIFSLNRKHWTEHSSAIALDIPRAKTRVQPNVVPAVKGCGGIAMMARELRAEIRPHKLISRGGNTYERRRFHKEVRRFENQPGRSVREARCKKQGNRGSITMPEEHGSPYCRRVQQLRKHAERFVMHVIHGPRPGEPLGLTVAAA